MKYPDLYEEILQNKMVKIATNISSYRSFPPVHFFNQISQQIKALNELLQELKEVELTKENKNETL